MENINFEIHDRTGSDDAKFIAARLNQFNDPLRVDVWKELTITAKDPEGTIIAGLNGSTNWGWLFVRLLWVNDGARGKNLGTQLLKQAEAEARARGCHSSWLDTFSFQAREFYLKQGYEVFGVLDDFPKGQQRFFFKKKL
jgi:GNAT superfamily N-acetyltransferase